MNNGRGRKMLISQKHPGHDLTLSDVVFKRRKHRSVYQISSLPPSGPRGLLGTSFLQFSFPLSESTVDSWEWSRGSRRGLRLLCNSWCQARMLLRCLVELRRAKKTKPTLAKLAARWSTCDRQWGVLQFTEMAAMRLELDLIMRGPLCVKRARYRLMRVCHALVAAAQALMLTVAEYIGE